MTDDYVPFVPPGRRRSGDVSDPIPLAEFVDRTRKLVAPVADSPPRTIKLVDSTELAGEPVPRRQWYVPDVLPASTVILLNGDGGTGKSVVALQLAFAGVYEVPWLGRQVTPGGVLFISAEDDMDELHRRLADIAAGAGTPLDRPGLYLTSLVGEDAILAAPSGRTNILAPTDLFAALAREVSELRPALLVLDTLADLFGGEENQRAQARAFIGLLKGLASRYQVTVLLLAHPSLQGMSSGSGTSGSTAWNNSVRGRLYFERVRDQDGTESDPDARVLKVMKSNYGRVGEEIRVVWRDGVFVPRDQPTVGFFGKIAAQDRADEVFLSLVQAFTAEGRAITDKTGPTFAPAVFAKDPRSQGIVGKGFDAAMRRLFASGKIRVETFGPPSKQRTRIAPVSPPD